MFLDFPFSLPVSDAGIPIRAPDGAVDEVLDARLLGGVGEILALRHVTLCADRPEILYAVDAINAAQTAIERRGILHVALHDLNALLEKRSAALLLGSRVRAVRFHPFPSMCRTADPRCLPVAPVIKTLRLLPAMIFETLPYKRFATPLRLGNSAGRHPSLGASAKFASPRKY